MSLPASIAWLAAGAPAAACAKLLEQRRRAAREKAMRRFILGSNITFAAGEQQKASMGGRIGTTMGARNCDVMVAWWKRLIYSLVSAVLGAALAGAWVAAQQ